MRFGLLSFVLVSFSAAGPTFAAAILQRGAASGADCGLKLLLKEGVIELLKSNGKVQTHLRNAAHFLEINRVAIIKGYRVSTRVEGKDTAEDEFISSKETLAYMVNELRMKYPMARYSTPPGADEEDETMAAIFQLPPLF